MLVYLVAVMFLAWWPWNLWLVFLGATYACRLYNPGTWRLLCGSTSSEVVGGPQNVHEALVIGRDHEAPPEYGRIIRHQHLRNTCRYSRVNPALASRRDSRHEP